MPYKATKLEAAPRIAPVRVMLLNDRNLPEEVILNVKYRPLTLQKLEEWEAIAAAAKKRAEERANNPDTVPAETAEDVEKDTLVRQLAEVVIDLDLVEDDGVTPKKVTPEYLKTLDRGLLKDIQAQIEERAFPEKKAWAGLTTP